MNDIINGLFELVGGLMCWLNFRKILKDKKVNGVCWYVTAFFSVWGMWNLYYYPSLGQWASFYGGVVLVVGNTAWVIMALIYSRKANKNKVGNK